MNTKVVAICSGKGGVGKSFVSVNLSVELAVQRKKVLLIDADVGLGNIHILLGKNPKYNIVDLMEGKCTLEEAVFDLAKGNLKVLAGGSGLSKLFHISNEKKKNLFKELKKVQNNYDVIILDIGAGINKEVLAFLELADRALLVTNPDLTAMADGYAILKTIIKADSITNNIGVIVNKATPDLGEQVHKKLNDATSKFLKKEIEFTGTIAENRKIAFEATQKRIPVYYLAPNSKTRKEFYKLSLKSFYNKEMHYKGNIGLMDRFMRFLRIEV